MGERPTPPTSAPAGPGAVDRLVPRPRVVERFGCRFTAPVVAVVARAGFGKSTALALSVAANHDAPLGSDVVVPSTRLHRTPGALVAELARELGAPTWEAEPLDALDALIDWCGHQRWRSEVCVALDDVHLLTGSASEPLLRRLVARAGTTLHVVLTSRAPLPWLAHHRSRGDVVDVDENCLRLDDDELEELASRRRVEVDRLRRFGGWPAIVDLVATYGTHEADAFVSEEVLAAAPVSRSELAAVAAVGGGDEELLSALSGRTVRPELIAAQVPLTSMGPTGELQVHPLWSELLGEGDDTRRARRVAAAHWCRRREHRRAVELALPTADADLLTEAIVGAFSDAEEQPDGAVVSDWMARLPAALGDHPVGWLLRGADAVRRDPYGDRPRALLEPSVAAWRDAGPPTGRAAALRQLVTAAFACGDREQLASLRSLALDADDDADGPGRQVSDVVDAAVALLDGHVPPPGTHAPSPFAGALAAARASPSGQGGLRAGGPALAAVVESVAAWRRGDLPAALSHADGPPADADRFDRYLAAVELAGWQARAGRIDLARAAIDAALGAAPPPGASWRAELDVARILVAVAEGADEAARRLSVALVEQLPLEDRARVLGREPMVVGCLHPDGPALTDPYLSHDDRRLRDGLRGVRRGEPVRGADHWPSGVELLARLPLRWVADLAAELTCADPDAAERIVADVVAVHGERGRQLVRTTDAAPLLVRTAVPPEDVLRLEVLGPVRLRRGGHEVTHPDWERPRVRELLCHLALCRHTTRDSVAAALWPDSDPGDAANSLRTHLSMLHAVLEPERWPGEATWVVRVEGAGLRLADPPEFVVDATQLRAALERCRGGGGADDLEAARASWRGRPLADLGDAPWIDALRAELTGDLVDATLALGAAAIADGCPDRAVAAAIDALQLDPWTEPGYQLLASAYLASGDRAAALRALERCDAMLSELGVTPHETTVGLRRRLA